MFIRTSWDVIQASENFVRSCGLTIGLSFSFRILFHDKEIWRISVRWTDRSQVTQNKINFAKNCPQWGMNSQPLDHAYREKLNCLQFLPTTSQTEQESPPAWTQEAGYPPPAGYPPNTRVPPPAWTWQGTPPPAALWHSGKCCKALWDMGIPPYGQTDRHVSKHYLPVVIRTRAVINVHNTRL